MKRSYYGMRWGRYGAAMTETGRLYAEVYVFPTRRSRDHWVRDGAGVYIGQPGYRWPASRREAQRALGWEDRGPYLVDCELCDRVFRDDCDLSRHVDACADGVR